MNKVNFKVILLPLTVLFASMSMTGCNGKAGTDDPNKIISNNSHMPVYVIERDLPGAGKLTPLELQAISLRSNGVLKEMGSGIKWMHSYVTDDKIYCVYSATDTSAFIAHAKKGGFPINRISAVHSMISTATAASK